jgi:hypothetical protein
MIYLLRSFLAYFAGFVTAIGLIIAIELGASLLYPSPPNLNPQDPAAMEAYMKTLPLGAFLMLIGAWVLGTFAGTWVTTLLVPGARRLPAVVMGLVFELATIAMLVTIPHPLWMWGACLLIPLAAALGSVLAHRPTSPAPEPAVTP